MDSTERSELIKQVFKSDAGKKIDDKEKTVIKSWLNGEPKWKAWAVVMRKRIRLNKVKDTTSLRVQASRFWSNERILRVIYELVVVGVIADNEARLLGKPYETFVNGLLTRLTDEERQKAADSIARLNQTVAEKAINDVVGLDDEKPKTKKKSTTKASKSKPEKKTSKQPDKKPTPNPDPKPQRPHIEPEETKIQERERIRRSFDEQRQAWLESFRDIENPKSTTAYGIGLWLAIEVIQQVNKKKAWIEKNRLSPMDSSPYSATDVSAIKAVLSALLPFAPAPTETERKAMTMAGVIIGLTADEMGVNPDEYTAPIPAGSKAAKLAEESENEAVDIDVDE